MIGASPRRKEDQRLLTGGGRFLDDLTREGLLHLGVVRSVEAHARLAKVATEAARHFPGVVLVWSASDLGEIAPHVPTAYGGAHKGRPWAQPVLVADDVAREDRPGPGAASEGPARRERAGHGATTEDEGAARAPTGTPTPPT